MSKSRQELNFVLTLQRLVSGTSRLDYWAKIWQSYERTCQHTCYSLHALIGNAPLWHEQNVDFNTRVDHYLSQPINYQVGITWAGPMWMGNTYVLFQDFKNVSNGWMITFKRIWALTKKKKNPQHDKKMKIKNTWSKILFQNKCHWFLWFQ